MNSELLTKESQAAAVDSFSSDTDSVYARMDQARKKYQEDEARRNAFAGIKTRPYTTLTKREKKILLRCMLEELQYTGMIDALVEYTKWRKQRKAAQKEKEKLSSARVKAITIQDLISARLAEI